MKHLFYLIGKSASGKDAIYEHLLKDASLALKPLVPWTTRPIRAKEQDGVEYHFTDEAGLVELERQGRVIEKRTYLTEHGPWTYFTVDDTDCLTADRIGIGTLESFRKMRDYYPPGYVVPIYVEVEDGIRLARALKRERKPGNHRYEEMCRRFLADQKDFSEENLKNAGIQIRFRNDKDREICFSEIASYIRAVQTGTIQTDAVLAGIAQTGSSQTGSFQTGPEVEDNNGSI